MADNVIANTSDGLGATFGTDNIGGVNYPRTKLIIGADGTNDGDVSSANPLPVTGTVAITNAALTELAAAINSSILDVNIAAQGGALTVASHAVTNAGTFAVQAAQSGTWNITNVSGTITLPTGASTAAKQPALGTAGTASADVLSIQGIASMTKLLVTPDANSAVNVAQINGVTTLMGNGASGTGAQRVTIANDSTGILAGVTTVTTVTAVTTLTGGGVAHDGADSGNPIKIGARAVSAEITPVSAADRVDLLTDLVGKLIVMPYCNPENIVSGTITSAMTGTTSTLLVAAPAGALRNYITQITVSCAHATQGTDIELQDGTAGTTFYAIPAAALYGGAAITFNPPLKQPTAATALYVKNTTTGSSTKASANGYKGV